MRGKKRRIEAFGRVFDSQSEVKFYAMLLSAKKSKDILFNENDDVQVTIPLIVKGFTITSYTMDFRFYTPKSTYWIEVKGWKTPYDAIRIKLFKALHSEDQVLVWHDKPSKPLHQKQNNKILKILGIINETTNIPRSKG